VSKTGEMFNEINTLISNAAKALGEKEDIIAKAAEKGELAIELAEDETGNRYLAVTYNGKTGRLYQGAIKYADGVAPPKVS
jgi:hypothetical protein